MSEKKYCPFIKSTCKGNECAIWVQNLKATAIVEGVEFEAPALEGCAVYLTAAYSAGPILQKTILAEVQSPGR